MLSWDEYKKKKEREFGLDIDEIVIQTPKPRYETQVKPKEKLFNIHKRSLPVGIDKVIFMAVTKLEAEFLLDDLLKAKVYTDDARNSKTLIYYDLIPVDAKPKEKSIYFNSPETKCFKGE